jgi:peptidoglycan hydrolase CwlO-like protein
LDSDISTLLSRVKDINKNVIKVKKEIDINERTIKILKKKITENREILLDYLIYLYKK